MQHGVGVIGSGPGAASLHVPTIARVPSFELRHVSDGGSGRARSIAEPFGARHSRGFDELLADDEVDVVVVCSPPEAHAEQVLAAVAAGKRGILCEKPLALTSADAHAVIEAARSAGVSLVVATNHLFDPAWVRAKHHLIAGGGGVRSVSVVASLPPNGRYHEVVSEPTPADASARRQPPDLADPEFAASFVRQLILGLAIHDIPTLRDLAPDVGGIVFAHPVRPVGVAFGFEAGDTLVQFVAAMHPGGADALWRMTIVTARDIIDVDFPPPFLHVGSAVVTVRDAEGTVTTYPQSEEDGYLAEWNALAAALEGLVPVEYDDMLADALYAIDLADAAAAHVLSGGRA